MRIKKLDKEIVHLNDSLTEIHNLETKSLLLELEQAEDSIKELNHLVKLKESEKNAAYERAEAVQRAAERINKNTTIKIESNSKDSVSINQD